jgi:molybdenum cofactor cytidylyltransferase
VNNVAAILLAAGRSERMGAFKPLLPFGNQTVLDSAIRTFQDAGISSIVVVCGWKASEIQKHLEGSDMILALNPDPSGDMGSSIACGVQELPSSTDAVLISPADLPSIPTIVVTDVINAWQAGSRLVVPTWRSRGGHPVLVDRAYFSELLTLDPANGLRGLFSEHAAEVTRLPVNSEYIARDLDTWDDYRELHQEIFGKAPPALGT